MQQRQLRLGDILDDYCPRERRVTNHAIVAMIGPDVKQTRCATCDTEHEYKHAKVPRQRRKSETPAALYSQVLAGGPKRVAHQDADAPPGMDTSAVEASVDAPPNGSHSSSQDAASSHDAASHDVTAPHKAAAPPDQAAPQPEIASGIVPERLTETHEEGENAEPELEDDDIAANGNVEEGPVHR